ncbi:hypothetical protein BH23GEM8_BH23GEM8_09230 [soil metagenome]
MTFRLHPLFLVLLLAGCAASPAELPLVPEPTSETRLAYDLSRLPDAVGALRLATMRAYPVAEMGSHYRYMGTGLVLDVYVYPIGRRVLAAAPGDPEREESATFVEVLEVQRRQGAYSSVRVTGQQPLLLEAGDRSFRAWRVSALVARGTAERETHQHLVTVGERFIKVRTTFPVGESRVEDVESYLSELLGMLEIDMSPSRTERPVAART